MVIRQCFFKQPTGLTCSLETNIDLLLLSTNNNNKVRADEALTAGLAVLSRHARRVVVSSASTAERGRI